MNASPNNNPRDAVLPEPRWKVELLGRLQISDGIRTIERFQTAKTASLFAFLAVNSHTSHPRETLIEQFWQDSDLAQGRPSLSVALSSLRRQLEPPGTEAGSVLIANRTTVQINPHAIQTDVRQFANLLDAAGNAASEADQVIAYRDTVALYGGELFPGCYDDWCLTERHRLLELHLHALRSLSRLLIARREGKQALAYAQKAVDSDPLREESHRDLMRILTIFGQPAAALRQYSELERILESELQASPSAATRALVQEIQARLEPTPQAVVSTPKSVQALSPNSDAVVKSAPNKPNRDMQTRTLLLLEWTGVSLERTALETAAARFQGEVTGLRQDSAAIVFGQAALAGQAALLLREQGHEQIRMALHTTEETQGKIHVEYLLAAAHSGQILCTAETAALLRRSSAIVQSLGKFRLAQALSPEPLFALGDTETDSTLFLRPKALPGQQGNLPTLLSPFVGRENELKALEEKLTPASATRLLTLTGSGGIGKTRLALETAGKLLPDYNGAVWFVPLADASEQEHMWSALADSIRLPYESGRLPLEAIGELLDTQPALFVFDNLEQVTEAAGLVIETLLAQFPALKCLVTSRQRLECNGEQEYPLDALAVPAADVTPAEAMRWEGVRFFVQRAQTVRPDFQLTVANTPIVIELCRQLDGLPLALELAAARAQVLTPAQMQERLSDRFALLAGKRRNVPERHQTLHAAIDWSYRLLSPALQRFFVRLSVFRGSWTLDAAEAICEETAALDLLSELCACSLVKSLPPVSEAVEIRFTMLESIRAFSAAQWEADEAAEHSRSNHRQWYAKVVADFGNNPDSFPLLEMDAANITAALSGFLEQSDSESKTTAAKMAVGLGDYWERRGLYAEGRKWLRASAIDGEDLTEKPLRIALYRWAGWFAHLQGDYAEANDWARQSLALCDTAPFAEERCHLLNNLALTAQSQGDFQNAHVYFAESLKWAETQGDRPKQAARLNNLGLLAIQQGEFPNAQRHLERAAQLYRELNDGQGAAACLCNLSDLSLKCRDWTNAQRLAEESLERFRQIGDRRGVALALTNLAEALLALGNAETALDTLEQAQKIAGTAGLHWLLPLLADLRTQAAVQVPTG